MKKSTPSWPTLNDINTWYESLLGQRILALEQQQIDQCLERVFGYHAICLGPLSPLNLEHCSVSNKIEIAAEFSTKMRASAVVNFHSLPFADQSIDLFVLPHVLEFSPDPKAVLHEVSRCLIGNGYVLIFGFNASSLFGLWRWLQGRSHNFPWYGKFLSIRKLCRWLTEFHFVIEECHTFYFRPPFQYPEALKKLKFLEVLGPLIWSQSGASYAVLARREQACLTPIRTFRKSVQPIKDLVAAHRERL